MQAIILAGGLGTRLSEETATRPKPMIEIGGKPILWHIMKIFSAYDINDFIICLGYKGYIIKEYFANYFLHVCDVTMDIANNRVDVLQNAAEPWKVTLVDTGDESMTGGRTSESGSCSRPEAGTGPCVRESPSGNHRWSSHRTRAAARRQPPRSRRNRGPSPVRPRGAWWTR